MFTIESGTDYAATYAAATVGEKNRMRSAIGDAIDAAVRSGDFASASALVAVRDTFGPVAKATPAVDYHGLFATRRASLVAAIDAIDAGSVVVPDGVTIDAGSVPTDADADASLVATYVTMTGRKNGRGDVPAYVSRVLSANDGAAMTASQIHNGWTAELGGDDYPDAGPSVGAIGAAFVRVIDGADGTDDYGWTVTTNDAGTRVASI